MIHDGSSRNRGVVKRDGRVEPSGREASLQRVSNDHGRARSPTGWSRRRIRDCRNADEHAG